MTFKVDQCLSCGCHELDFRLSIISPFISSRSLLTLPTPCRIAKCRRCGPRFFEDRFGTEEVARLYDGYRDEAYLKARQTFEPWYSAAFNSGLGGEDEMVARRQLYGKVVHANSSEPEITSVLDYGGDRGQLMKDGPGREHFVYDISGAKPDEGVTAVPDLVPLEGRQFDLVLLTEVLEHVSHPDDILAEVKHLIKSGGFLYITVPNREFYFDDIPKGSWYRHYLKFLLSSPWLTLLLDFWSTGFRVKFRRVAPLGFVKMHEHVTFFEVGSLKALLCRNGLTVLHCGTFGRDRGVVALCKKL